MAFGFMVNESTVSGIADFYDATKPVKLGVFSTDPYSRVAPQACYLSQLDLRFSASSSSPRCLKVLLTWDSVGADPVARETEKEIIVTGPSGAIMTVVPLDTYVRAPSTQTQEGEVYAWLKVDKGTVDLSVARLQWATRTPK